MASYNKFESFVEKMAEKVHDLDSDTLTVALCAAANAPIATNDVLADLTEVNYANCSARAITTTSGEETSGTYKLVLVDLVLTAGGGTVGPLRYVVIYNDTAASDELICFYDYGAEITLKDGETLTIDFDAANGLLQIA